MPATQTKRGSPAEKRESLVSPIEGGGDRRCGRQATMSVPFIFTGRLMLK